MRWDGGNGRTKCELQQKRGNKRKERVRRRKREHFLFFLLGGRKDEERKTSFSPAHVSQLVPLHGFLAFFLCVSVWSVVCVVCVVCVCLSSVINTLWLADHLYHRGAMELIGQKGVFVGA